ncbi:MAG: UDP-glucose/GDP-mannose dehydrogenase family protein [Chitinophagaceae bacterium]
MNITVVGTGYVGLVSGICFAESGNHVVCVDNNINKVERLKNGEMVIYEPGLETLFHRNNKENRIHFTSDLKYGVEHGDIIFFALPTPPGEDGQADLKYVLGVAEEVGKILSSIKKYKVIVNKSTVPVGTAEKVHNVIATHYQGEFDVVSNPEFLREGAAVEDFMKPDRVVIGSESEKAIALMTKLYQPFVRQGNPVYVMDVRSAEITKYASNAYLALRITFMNELANYCEKVGADIETVRVGMGSDSRIGKRFLFPGIGYGGSCFPKDVMALVQMGDKEKFDFSILKSVLQVNNHQRKILAHKIIEHFGKQISGKKIAVWGLAFKPNTDDVREAPALYVIEELIQAGAQVHCYDPEAMPNTQQYIETFKPQLKNAITYADNAYEAIHEADALAICTEWGIFRAPEFDKMNTLLKEKIIFDGRNLFDTMEMKQRGYIYYSIGRNTQHG